ncbi:MAG TPA: SIS domain-containing protein [Ktedonobacterales bacterium]|nr:SIS domain-containing protein [Ktedonobacterales bacterium]
MSIPVRPGHPYCMYDEILAQPEAIRRLLATDEQQRNELAALLVNKRRFVITGCGTALHAALAGEHLLRWLTRKRRDTRAFQAFELTEYGPALDSDTALFVLSHSGTATASIRALEKGKREGALCLTITAYPESPAATAADAILLTGYPQQQSAVYTVSYTLMVALLADLAWRIGLQAPDGSEAVRVLAQAATGDIASMPDLVQRALGLEEQMKALAERYQDRQRFFFLGGGPHLITAQEAALKMMEANYTASTGMHIEEFIHGPISSLDARDVAVIITPPGATHNRALDVLKAAQVIGAETIALTEADDEEIKASATHTVSLPICPEPLSILPAIVPLQLFTYYVALAHGVNPDLIHRHDERYAAARRGYIR